MKRSIKKILTWVGQLEDSLKSLAAIFYTSRCHTTARKLAGTCRGTCYVMGNGPSLRVMLEKKGAAWLNGQAVCMVNDAVLSDYYIAIRPSFYVLADPGYFNSRLPQLPGYSEPMKTFEALNQKTGWQMCLFAPANVLHLLRARITNSCITLCSYNASPFKGFNTLRILLYRHGWAMPQPQNVLVAAIFLAINMGYPEINMLGAEHSWLRNLHVNDRNKVVLVNDHFYDNDKISATVWKKCNGTPYLLHEALADLSRMFASYRQLEDYARSRGCVIFNCTPNSFIDAFKRKKLY
ncbi:MAG: hypothetical protein LBU42_05135 [Prevotellaceae bacterium]|jgi:hypothetical protein|nr:hypothetical protein [Prevotellaceae bacterium]